MTVSPTAKVLLGPALSQQPMAALNHFRWLPPPLRPPDRAILLGGSGAVSSLHADMSNWTGWNALFTGRKLWRFFPPAVSLPVVSRHGKVGNLSADYVSVRLPVVAFSCRRPACRPPAAR